MDQLIIDVINNNDNKTIWIESYDNITVPISELLSCKSVILESRINPPCRGIVFNRYYQSITDDTVEAMRRSINHVSIEYINDDILTHATNDNIIWFFNSQFNGVKDSDYINILEKLDEEVIKGIYENLMDYSKNMLFIKRGIRYHDLEYDHDDNYNVDNKDELMRASLVAKTVCPTYNSDDLTSSEIDLITKRGTILWIGSNEIGCRSVTPLALIISNIIASNCHLYMNEDDVDFYRSIVDDMVPSINQDNVSPNPLFHILDHRDIIISLFYSMKDVNRTVMLQFIRDHTPSLLANMTLSNTEMMSLTNREKHRISKMIMMKSYTDIKIDNVIDD